MRRNDGTSWPVEVGGTCIGCASPEFWSNASPFYSRLPNVAGFGADTTAETVGVGVGVVVGVTALMAAHGVGKALQAARAHEPVAASTKEAGGPPAEARVQQAEAGEPDAEAGVGGGSAQPPPPQGSDERPERERNANQD